MISKRSKTGINSANKAERVEWRRRFNEMCTYVNDHRHFEDDGIITYFARLWRESKDECADMLAAVRASLAQTREIVLTKEKAAVLLTRIAENSDLDFPALNNERIKAVETLGKMFDWFEEKGDVNEGGTFNIVFTGDPITGDLI